MKCTITNTETNGLTNGIPLSREGRTELAEITTEYNEKLRERFLKSFIEKSGKRDDDMLEAVKKLGGNGTPTFVLNGKKIDNPESTVSAFSRILDNELPQQIDVE